MDIIGIICTVAVIIIIFSICSYCCRKHRGKVLGPPQPGLTVTTTTSQPVQPPYPVATPHPVPQPMPPPGIGFQPAAGYPPYPVGTGTAMPQPYPPVSQPAMAPPPSYHEAVGVPLAGPAVVQEHYAKQSPYNPHY